MSQAPSLITPRIEPVQRDRFTAEQRRLVDAAFGDAPVPNLFATVLANTELFEAWLPFCMKLLSRSVFAKRERELVILRVASACAAEYEWHHHVAIGLRAGLTDSEIESLTKPGTAAWEGRDRALLEAVDQLVARHTVDSDQWEELVAAGLTIDQLIELPMLVGHYALLAGTLNALAVSADELAGGSRPSQQQGR